METILAAITDSSDVRGFDLYLMNIYEIYEGREIHRYYGQADTFVYLLLLKI